MVIALLPSVDLMVSALLTKNTLAVVSAAEFA